MWVQTLGWEDPLEKEMATIPVLSPGESHGQRSLTSHSPRGHKEWDATEATSSVQFSCSVVSDSLRTHGLQHQILELTQTHVH